MAPRHRFYAACAVIALHVIISEVFVLEPGTSANDRWTAVVVPLVVLIAACLLYGRVRPGIAGAVALSIGSLALAGGVLAVASIGPEGFNASTLTGIAMLCASLALTWRGAAVLWESRRPQGRPLLRRSLILLASAIFAFEVLLPIGFALVATHRPATAPSGAGIDQAYEEVSFLSDGLELEGWYVPSRNGAAVVVFPDRSQSAPYVNMLAAQGFGVLSLDMRGYGSSEGNPNAYGWEADADINAAVSYLRGRPDVTDGRVGGLGLSVGGEQMIDAAAVNPALRAVVSEGAGERSVRETMLFGPEAALAIPQQAVLTLSTSVFSGDGPPAGLDESAAAIAPRPVFFIYAEDGQAGEQLNEEFYEAADEPKEIWEVADGGHLDAISAAPVEYEKRVVAFFEGALLGSAAPTE